MIDVAHAYATYASELRRYVARRADGAADADDMAQPSDNAQKR